MICSRCSATPCSCGPSSAIPGCVPGGPVPGAARLPGNQPPKIRHLACTLGSRIQPAIDRARKVAHTLGFRPYRVRLVWQKQDEITGEWAEVHELELMPVEVRSMAGVDLRVESSGQMPTGILRLQGISPILVDEWTLRGYLQGQPWSANDPKREFFYEIQQIPQCEGDPTPQRYRFILASAPEYDGDGRQWIVRITDQFGRRAPDGTDTTVPGELYEPQRARLVP